MITKEDKLRYSLSIMKMIIFLDAIDDEMMKLGQPFQGEPKQFLKNTRAGMQRRFGSMVESLFEIDFKNDSTNLEDLKEEINKLIEQSVNII